MSKKKTIIPVNSMGDLIEIVNHNADVAEQAVKKFSKSNRNLKVLCIVALGYAVYATIKAQKQEEQIYQLSVRVKKLERSEGE